MTCIVAVEDATGTIMGADRAASGSELLTVLQTSKLFRNGPALFGYTSSMRMGQLMQYDVTLKPPSSNVGQWVVTELVPALRTSFLAGGFERSKDGESSGGCFLVSIGGNCFEVQDDYSFLRSEAGEYAIGSGAAVALGSLHSTRGRPADERVAAALAAAADYALGVSSPFDLEVDPKGAV